MAVNINTVYQKVLALANKEQRGYITPQEFNLFADQAQLEIFHNYFREITRAQFDQTKTDDYIDSVDMLKEKMGVHRKIGLDALTLKTGSTSTYILPADLYAIEDIQCVYSSGEVSIANELSYRDRTNILHNKLLQPSKIRPHFIRDNENTIRIEPNPISNTFITYFKIPATPKWTYVVVNNKALYNASANDAQNFTLHESEENNLIIRILELSGITLKDTELNQIAMRDKLNTKAEKRS